MEHWDAWLAEDLFKETESNEGNPATVETASTKIMVKTEQQKPKKKVKTRKKIKGKVVTKKLNIKLNLTNSEEENDDSHSPSPVICTPKRGIPTFSSAFQFEKPKEERIYVQKMLDERIPLEDLLRMEMPQELKEELRDWDEKFPNLSVYGKLIGESPELEERKQLRQIIGRRIVEMHLWPEINMVLSTKRTKKTKKGEKLSNMPEVDEWIKESTKNGKKKGKMDKKNELKLPAIIK